MNKTSTIEGVYDGLLESVRRVDNYPKPLPQVEEQVVYKLMHKGTGLFYDPQKHLGNVSVIGKLYNQKPIRHLFLKIPKSVKLKDRFNSRVLSENEYYSSYDTVLEDWEVVEYTLTEVNKGG